MSDKGVIEVRDFRKTYGSLVAVEGSTFRVNTGEIVGLVGPNGAGKTTTLKAIAGLVEPTGGTVLVAGGEPLEGETRRDLGWLPEESPLYEEMTAESYLRFFADLYDVPRSVADERIQRTLDRLDLDVRTRPLGDCSKGMRRKVAIARAVINDPTVLLFDEPASGLDPLTTKTVLEFTRELAADGKTVLFSAHNLHHVESVCDRVAIMGDGRILAKGTVPELREAYGESRYEVYTTVPVDGSEPAGDRHCSTVESMRDVETVRGRVADRGGELVDIKTREPSLEDIFLGLTDASNGDGSVTQSTDDDRPTVSDIEQQ